MIFPSASSACLCVSEGKSSFKFNIIIIIMCNYPVQGRRRARISQRASSWHSSTSSSASQITQLAQKVKLAGCVQFTFFISVQKKFIFSVFVSSFAWLSICFCWLDNFRGVGWGGCTRTYIYYVYIALYIYVSLVYRLR